jgi:hypothetical protein
VEHRCGQSPGGRSLFSLLEAARRLVSQSGSQTLANAFTSFDSLRLFYPPCVYGPTLSLRSCSDSCVASSRTSRVRPCVSLGLELPATATCCAAARSLRCRCTCIHMWVRNGGSQLQLQVYCLARALTSPAPVLFVVACAAGRGESKKKNTTKPRENKNYGGGTDKQNECGGARNLEINSCCPNTC